MTTSDPSLLQPPNPPTPKKSRKVHPATVITVIVIVLAAAFVIGERVNLSYYALAPGYAQSVSPLISLPKQDTHSPHGKILLTDVSVQSVNAVSFLYDRFSKGVQLVKTQELTADLPVSEFDDEGTVDMEESQMTAASVALRQLGIPVPEHDAGVTIYAIVPGSPAWKKLSIGEVITKIGDKTVDNSLQLTSAIRSYKPGDTVELEVGSVENPQSTKVISVKLGSVSEEVPQAPLGCADSVPQGTQYVKETEPFLGLGDPAGEISGFGTQPQYPFPVNVSINSDNIGGPSAGLAWTLGIIDSMIGGNLTGGRIVAATGTIDPDGSVGEVGGVEQKTVAVERAGATLFLVPSAEVSDAKSVAGPGLKVVGVGNLDQALRAIAADGGHLGKAAAGPSANAAGDSYPTCWQDSPWS